MIVSLKDKTTTSVMWSAVEKFSTLSMQFLLNIFIARLISPSDYGLIAMLGIFLAVAQTFVDSGFSSALIQKNNRTEADFSTTFYFNITVAIGTYFLLFAVSSQIASFYNEPQLEMLTKWVGLNFVISSFYIVQQTILIINLDFKKQAFFSLVSVILSGLLGIILAIKGYGVWALIFQSLSNNLIYTILLWIGVRWIPKLVFSWVSFKSLFGFGSKILLGGLMHTVYQNIYSLVIGKKFSAIDLGFYNRSFSLAIFPSKNITNIISRVVYPVQCSIQDNEQLERSFIQSLRMSMYIIFPLMTSMCILSDSLILILLTEKWLPAASFLSILCIAYMWDPVQYLNWQFLSVKGRTDLSLRSEIVKKITAVIILITSIPFGIKWMCYGLILYAILDVLIIIFYIKKVSTINYTKEMKNIIPFVLLSVAMGTGIWGSVLFIELPILKLAIGIISGITLYALFSYLFQFNEFYYIISLIKKLWHRNMDY